MNGSSKRDRPRFVWYQRGILVLLGVGLLTLLAVAAWLAPNPSGLGTHRQLGLPACAFAVVLGIPCPSCGMTTSWAHLLDGNIVLAVRANVGGTLLAVFAIVLGPWTLISGLRGQWSLIAPREWIVVAVCCCIVLITLVDWGIRLASS